MNKKYYIVKRSKKEENFDFYNLSFYNKQDINDDLFCDEIIGEFKNKKEAYKEFNKYYAYDDENNSIIEHFELRKDDGKSDKILILKESKINIDIIVSWLKDAIIRDCIENRYIPDSKNDQYVEDILNKYFSYNVTCSKKKLFESIKDESYDIISDNKDNIIKEILYIVKDIKKNLNSCKYACLNDLDNLCSEYRLEELQDYEYITKENIDNNNNCILCYSIGSSSCMHIYIDFTIKNYAHIKELDNERYLEESEIIINDIYIQ